MAIPFLSDISGKSADFTGSVVVDGNGSSSILLKTKGSARIALENANATDSFYISNTGGNGASVLDLGGSLSLIENGDANFTGSVTATHGRFTSTGDASISSTDHAFQAGTTNSTNIIIDNNEIMARNNGATAVLNFNPDGNTVTFHSNTSNASQINDNGNATFAGAVVSNSASGFKMDAAVDMQMAYYSNVASTIWGIFSSNNHADTVISTNLKIDQNHDLVTNQTHSNIKGSGIVFTGNQHHAGAGAIAMYALGNGSATAGTVTAEENYALLIKDTSATFAGQVKVTSDIFLNPDYVNANEYLYLRKHQSGDGGIIFQSKTSGGATQSDFQIRNQGTTGDLKFYAYGLAGEALILDRENGNATFAGTIDSKAITALAKGTQLGTSGYYINSTFKDTGDNVGVFLAHNDTSNGVGAIAGINQLAFLTYGSAWTQALLLDGSQNATFAGNVSLAGNLNVNGVAQHHEARYTDANYVVSFDRTSSSDQYFKIITNGGSPKRVRLSITSTGDNTNTRDTYYISQSGYNMQSHIFRLPGSKYNTSKLVSILCINSSGATQEIWIKLLGMSSGTGTTTIAANVPVSTSSAILATATTTKPTLSSGDSELDVVTTDRNNYTTMSSAGAKFGGKINVGTNNEVDIVSSGSSLFPSLKVNNNGYVGAASVTDALQFQTSGDLKVKNKLGIGRSAVAKLTIEGDGSVDSNIFFQQSGSQEHRIYAATNNQYNTIGSSSPNWYWGQHQSSGSPTIKMSLVGDALTAGSFVKSGGTSSQFLMADGSVSTGVASHDHDDRYYTETELDAGQLDNRYYTETEIDSNFYGKTAIDAKFTSSNGSEDEWKFTLGDESNLSGNKWYKVATINQGSGGLHIKGSFSNHVESFGTQHIDLLLQGREGNDGDEIEINGTVNVVHNAGTGTDKVGIRVIEADTSSSPHYHYYDVYMRTTRYTQAKFHLTKFGTTGFHTSKPSVTSEPAPVSGGSVELDTSTLASGNHVIVDSSVKSSIADSTGYVGLGVAPTSNQRLTLAEADGNGSHIKMNNSRSGGGYWIVGVGDTNSSSGIVDPGGLFFYNGTTRLKFSSAGHATFANNVTITGDLEVNGTTTTVNATNLDLSDNIIGLNRGASSNSNDSGLIIERGSTGDNAAMIWDEANDRFVFGLTTSTPAATGSVSISSTSNLAARDLDVNNVTCGRIVATAASTGIHQLINASTNSTVLQLISTGDNPDHALNLQTDHIYTSSLALHIGIESEDIYLRGAQTTVGTTTPVSGYELTVVNGPGKSIHTSGTITTLGGVEFSTGLIKYEQNTDVDSAAAEAVASVVKATHTAAFFDYVIKKGTNVRAGVVAACHDGTNVEYAETSTVDLGDTSDVTLSVDISGTYMRLIATTTSDDWSVKSLIRAI